MSLLIKLRRLSGLQTCALVTIAFIVGVIVIYTVSPLVSKSADQRGKNDKGSFRRTQDKWGKRGQSPKDLYNQKKKTFYGSNPNKNLDKIDKFDNDNYKLDKTRRRGGIDAFQPNRQNFDQETETDKSNKYAEKSPKGMLNGPQGERMVDRYDPRPKNNEIPVQPAQNREKLQQSDDSSKTEASAREKFPFRDITLSWEARVDDLVGRLTVEEITQQTIALYYKPTPAIPRLGIKRFQWITECLHGQYKTTGTAFPQAIGLAATWSPDLLKNISTAIGTEVRANWNEFSKKDQYKTYIGITCFSPTINIMRHPQWRRNEETYGEDPFLTGTLGAEYVKGLQGSHERYIQAAATCKHFAAHSGPEKGRLSFNAQVSESDMHMTYLPHFKKCVEAGALGIMCSYNRINNQPACAHKYLLTNTLRENWKFKGFVVSDARAIINMVTSHGTYGNKTLACAAAIDAGCNLELATEDIVYERQPVALKTGLLTEKQIRDNIKPLIYTRMRLGEFDPTSMNPYNDITGAEIQSEKHRALATKAASMSFVLLKNIRKTLPLQGTYKKIAIIGRIAKDVRLLYGGYSPLPNRNYTTTPYKSLRKLAKENKWIAGCPDGRCSESEQQRIGNATQSSDLVIFCMTGDVSTEFTDILRIEKDKHVLQFVLNSARPDTRIIIVLFSGNPVNIKPLVTEERIGAIIMAFLPAQASGPALINILTMNGPDSAPAGRLPFTWPLFENGHPDIKDYGMDKKDAEKTYRYSPRENLFPFGYGLSYSQFTYSELTVDPQEATAGTSISVSVKVTNTGEYDSDEVVQVYISWKNIQLPGLPRLQLVGFKRVHISSKKSAIVKFLITPNEMKVWYTNEARFNVPGAVMKLYVGGQQPETKVKVNSNVLETTVKFFKGSADQQGKPTENKDPKNWQNQQKQQENSTNQVRQSKGSDQQGQPTENKDPRNWQNQQKQQENPTSQVLQSKGYQSGIVQNQETQQKLGQLQENLRTRNEESQRKGNMLGNRMSAERMVPKGAQRFGQKYRGEAEDAGINKKVENMNAFGNMKRKFKKRNEGFGIEREFGKKKKVPTATLR